LLPVSRSLARFTTGGIPPAGALSSDSARQQKPGTKGRAKLARDATERLEARHHALETEQVGERFKLPPLVVAKAHDQGKPRRFEPFDIHLAHVDRGRAAAVLRFPRVLHLAQFGLDRWPIALLVRRQIESPLDARKLRLVEDRV